MDVALRMNICNGNVHIPTTKSGALKRRVSKKGKYYYVVNVGDAEFRYFEKSAIVNGTHFRCKNIFSDLGVYVEDLEEALKDAGWDLPISQFGCKDAEIGEMGVCMSQIVSGHTASLLSDKVSFIIRKKKVPIKTDTSEYMEALKGRLGYWLESMGTPSGVSIEDLENAVLEQVRTSFLKNNVGS